MAQPRNHRQITVVNIHHKNRFRYNVYIGRSRAGQPRNPLQNDYRIGEDGDRIDVICKFIADFRHKWENDPQFKQAVLDLHGPLGCFCAPKPCHGDVYRIFLESYAISEEAAFNAIERYAEELKASRDAKPEPDPPEPDPQLSMDF